MPLTSHRSRVLAVAFLVAVLLSYTSMCFYQGKTPSLYPESSWGPWKHEQIASWSTHVRVNTWTHAAQAQMHYGKAEDISLGAYGKTVHESSVIDQNTFTLTPDGRLTAQHP
ncbi:hypothetical protein [Streptomyces sp. NPDC054838]